MKRLLLCTTSTTTTYRIIFAFLTGARVTTAISTSWTCRCTVAETACGKGIILSATTVVSNLSIHRAIIAKISAAINCERSYCCLASTTTTTCSLGLKDKPIIRKRENRATHKHQGNHELIDSLPVFVKYRESSSFPFPTRGVCKISRVTKNVKSLNLDLFYPLDRVLAHKAQKRVDTQ